MGHIAYIRGTVAVLVSYRQGTDSEVSSTVAAIFHRRCIWRNTVNSIHRVVGTEGCGNPTLLPPLNCCIRDWCAIVQIQNVPGFMYFDQIAGTVGIQLESSAFGVKLNRYDMTSCTEKLLPVPLGPVMISNSFVFFDSNRNDRAVFVAIGEGKLQV